MTGLIIMGSALLLFTPFVYLAGREPGGSDESMIQRFSLVKRRPSVTSEMRDGMPDYSFSARERGIEVPLFVRKILDRLLKVANFQSLSLRSGSRISATSFLCMCLFAQLSVGCAVLFMTDSRAGSALLGVAAGFLPGLRLRMRCARRLKDMEAILPQVVEMIARALRAGHSLQAALSIVAEEAPEPARQEFGELFRKQKYGFPLREALLELLERMPSQDLRVLVVCILVQRETGGNLNLILDRSSKVIRERLKLKGDVRVHTAQGRLTGWILCALPVLLFVFMHLVNPSYTSALTEDPFGRKCLYASVGGVLLGAFLIRQIINGIEV